MKVIGHFLTIAVAILTIFAILNTNLSGYLLGILGIVVVLGLIYFFGKKRLRPQEEIFSGSNLEVYTIIIVILLAIFVTGGFNSLIFFLIYLLPFGIAIGFEPIMAFVLLAGLLSLFIQVYIGQELTNYWLQFVMLIAVTPISYFFGKEFHRGEQQPEANTAKLIGQETITHPHASKIKKKKKPNKG